MPRPQVALQAVHEYYGEQLGIMGKGVAELNLAIADSRTDALNAVKALSCPLQIHQKGGVNLCQNAIGFERTSRILQLLDDLHFHKYVASTSTSLYTTDAILRDTILIVQFSFCRKHDAEHYPGEFKNRFETVFDRARQCPIFQVEEVAGHRGGKWGDDRVRKLVEVVEESGTGVVVKGKGKGRRMSLVMEEGNGKRRRSERQCSSRGGGSDSDGRRDSVLSQDVSNEPYWLSGDASFGSERLLSTTTDSGRRDSVQPQGAQAFPTQQECLVQYQPQQFPTQQESLVQYQPQSAQFIPTQQEALFQSQPQHSTSMVNVDPASFTPHQPDPWTSDLSNNIVYANQSAGNSSLQPFSTAANETPCQSAPFETSTELAPFMDSGLDFDPSNTIDYNDNSAGNSSSQLSSTASTEACYESAPYVDSNEQFDPNFSFNYCFPIDLGFPADTNFANDSNLPNDTNLPNNSNLPQNFDLLNNFSLPANSTFANDSQFPNDSSSQSNTDFLVNQQTMTSNGLLAVGEESDSVQA
ncbi:unnamed protein product [Zymoseptoria tritici ST99CH_1A5]|uniref:Uncharacterized protein n=2 Tax=Zymoseptoria tritici TaxID=1047171 RepID=A0A2H1H9E3_ZYMTR|nr:unnamed protein product [Zymoseptoria tritici ST99CH_1E4]SMR64843.1 unnamed protein product [Zymoseptoria tritici ST99CH_3D1]SMY30236.1 unnamed protein product [Zymoseptoria tritici ST99CH_1A5]